MTDPASPSGPYPYPCSCSRPRQEPCCPTPAERKAGGGLSRRSFLKASSVTLAAAPFTARTLSAIEQERRERWMRELLRETLPRRYRGEQTRHIVIPMGGLGAGNIGLRGDGSLGPWQIVNNFNSNAELPGSFFAVRARAEGAEPVARLLQARAIDELPGVTAVELEAEYPIARLFHLDGLLPVAVEAEVFSPMTPLEPDDSGLPAVLFEFTVTNRQSVPVEVSLLGSLQNASGWDGYSKVTGVRSAGYFANLNRLHRDTRGAAILMGTTPGEPDRFARPVAIRASHGEVAQLWRFTRDCSAQHVASLADLPGPAGGDAAQVLWIEDVPEGVAPTDAEITALLEAVAAGATLVLAGASPTHPVRRILDWTARAAEPGRTRPLADFESGSWEGWTLEGDCFGPRPSTGTHPNQNRVSGWRGRYLVNTYFPNTDDTTGHALSAPFRITHRYLHFLVGGGNHEGTAVRLRVDGKVVATARGKNTEQLARATWDLAAHRDREAQIEIVDEVRGGWGHILCDDFALSDDPEPTYLTAEVAGRLAAALPVEWPEGIPAEPVDLGATSGGTLLRDSLDTRPARLRPGARALLAGTDDAPAAIAGALGKGAVLVLAGSPLAWSGGRDARALVGPLLAELLGTEYTPQNGWPATAPHAGTLALGVDDPGATGTEQYAAPAEIWPAWLAGGTLPAAAALAHSAGGATWNGALSTSFRLEPGARHTARFAICWHFPNRYRDQRYGWAAPNELRFRLGNRYNTRFADAAAVLKYVVDKASRLAGQTRRYRDALYDSTLPRWFVDCISANSAILRSAIYLWLEDGTWAGFEGADNCCPMNCTHVYNYAQSAAFLYPSLEQNVRETDLLVQQHPEHGYIPHRTVLPLSEPRLWERGIGGPHDPALDGMLGTVLKAYREWALGGGDAWLARVWPRLELLMRHIMTKFDAQGDGVIRIAQPNTYDIHTYGSNTFIGTLYLAALRAAEEMAAALDRQAAAQRYRERFAAGSRAYDAACWEDGFYVNRYDAPGASPETYEGHNCWGPGCHADQLLGQWWAHLLGLGHLLPVEHVRAALRSIFAHNFRYDLSDHEHTQRVFAAGTEKGLLNCSWPRGGRPRNPIAYCDEVWTGIEYQVAAHMICEGLVDEGLAVVKAARERYTGEQRNPWSEIECGSYYARALASWSLLTAVSGWVYHAARKRLEFAPRLQPERFRAFFSAGTAWGNARQERPRQGVQRDRIDVLGGRLDLAHLVLEWPGAAIPAASVTLAGHVCTAAASPGPRPGTVSLALEPAVTIQAGDFLDVLLEV